MRNSLAIGAPAASKAWPTTERKTGGTSRKTSQTTTKPPASRRSITETFCWFWVVNVLTRTSPPRSAIETAGSVLVTERIVRSRTTLHHQPHVPRAPRDLPRVEVLEER